MIFPYKYTHTPNLSLTSPFYSAQELRKSLRGNGVFPTGISSFAPPLNFSRHNLFPPSRFFQQLEDIVLSLQAGNPLTGENKMFLQANAERVKARFPEEIVEISRFINSSVLPPGGIQQVRDQIRALELSLSLLEDRLTHFENRRISGENLEEAIESVRTTIIGTRDLLQAKQNIRTTFERHETYLQAVALIQEFVYSLQLFIFCAKGDTYRIGHVISNFL